jgi:outer membrane lipoprotein-sorting protein
VRLSRTRVKSFYLLPTLACLGFLLASCAGAPTRPAPLAMLPPAPQAVKRLEARRLFVQSFAMQGEIRLEGDRGEISGEHLIQGVYPNKLRAEIMGPFNRPVLLLISDGRWLAVLDYRDNKAYLGQASRRNLERFVGLDVSLERIYALLTGSMDLAPGAEAIRLSPDSQTGLAKLKLVYTGGMTSEELLFDPLSYSLYKAELQTRDGTSELETSFGEFQKGASFSYPLKVELRDSSDRKLVLSSDSLKINPPLKDDIFTPTLPKGVPVELMP